MLLTIVSFFIVLSILVVVHEAGHFVVAKWRGVKVEEFGLGYPPRVLTIARKGETVYTINAIPFGGFVRLSGEENPNAERAVASQPKWARIAIMGAGSAMNLLLAVICFTLVAGFSSPHVQGVPVDSVFPDTPAAGAGLMPGDLVLSADETRVETAQDLIDYTRPRAGEEIALLVQRDGTEQTLLVTPRLSEAGDRGEIGIGLGNEVTWPQAVGQGFMQTIGVIWLTITMPILLLRGAVPLEAARPVGPVGIAQLTGGAVAQSLASGWWVPTLYLMALLSTAIAITNLLPLPALDGGRIFFVIVEAIRGKRVPPEKEGFIHLIGFVALIALVVVITFVDITSPLPAVDWSQLF